MVSLRGAGMNPKFPVVNEESWTACRLNVSTSPDDSNNGFPPRWTAQTTEPNENMSMEGVT